MLGTHVVSWSQTSQVWGCGREECTDDLALVSLAWLMGVCIGSALPTFFYKNIESVKPQHSTWSTLQRSNLMSALVHDETTLSDVRSFLSTRYWVEFEFSAKYLVISKRLLHCSVLWRKGMFLCVNWNGVVMKWFGMADCWIKTLHKLGCICLNQSSVITVCSMCVVPNLYHGWDILLGHGHGNWCDCSIAKSGENQINCCVAHLPCQIKR